MKEKIIGIQMVKTVGGWSVHYTCETENNGMYNRFVRESAPMGYRDACEIIKEARK